MKKIWKPYCKLRLKVQLCRNLLRHCVKRQLIYGGKQKSNKCNKGNGKLVLKGSKRETANSLRFPMSLLTTFGNMRPKGEDTDFQS